jgi:hypothetical protein
MDGSKASSVLQMASAMNSFFFVLRGLDFRFLVL